MQTYEIINPADVGADSSKIVLTAQRQECAGLPFPKAGFAFDRNDVDTLYEQFLAVADSKKRWPMKIWRPWQSRSKKKSNRIIK